MKMYVEIEGLNVKCNNQQQTDCVIAKCKTLGLTYQVFTEEEIFGQSPWEVPAKEWLSINS